VAKRRDPHLQDIHEGELEHGWAGAVEIDNERPSTGLEPDPSARKWVLLGVGTSCLLTAGFVLLAMGNAPAQAAELAAPLSELARGELQSRTSQVRAGIEPDSGAQETLSGSTLAASSSAAVTSKRRSLAPPPATASPPPVEMAKPVETAKPVAPVETAKPIETAKPAAAAKPVAAVKPAATSATPKPAESAETPELPSLPDSGGELPDVQGWDDADDEALRDPTAVEPS
jgi:hypothetical protein